MAAEAEKLINLSLTKIAKSRAQRGGVSLHRNLLVATVLQRARFVFMEEAYHMVQRHDSGLSTNMFEEQQHQGFNNCLNFDVCGHIVASEVVVDDHDDSADSDSRLFTVLEEANKENLSLQLPSEPSSAQVEFEPRLREDSSILREKLETNSSAHSHSTSRCLDIPVSVSYSSSHSPSSLKRRRVVVAEWETEEAILSILPKKARREAGGCDESEESAILDEIVTALPGNNSTNEVNEENVVTSMEIDRITSLVSIFSFGGLSGGNSEVFSGGVMIGSSTDTVGKLTRSVSTPDLCSAQAKEGGGVDVMQRPFLAMTV